MGNILQIVFCSKFSFSICPKLDAKKSKGKMAASEIKNQLHVFHNPFADTTSQPKIPDGKCNDSLGFCTQAVQEISNAEGENTMHMLIYAGMNAACVIDKCAQATRGSRTYYIPHFSGSGNCDWDDAGHLGTAAFNVRNSANYGQWRTVSVGAQLKLLNPVDQDDGWWEAIRISPEFNNSEWWLTTTNNSGVASTYGTVSPVGLLKSSLSTDSMVNEQTYSTGLIRDLNRVQFECHGKLDHHDFHQNRNEIHIETGAIASIDNGVEFETKFNLGFDCVKDIVDQWVDPGYDMIYLRLHCRENTPLSTTFLGSRFHLNIQENQEIIYDTFADESRYHTKTYNIGADAASLHGSARRLGQNAAKLAYN